MTNYVDPTKLLICLFCVWHHKLALCMKLTLRASNAALIFKSMVYFTSLKFELAFSWASVLFHSVERRNACTAFCNLLIWKQKMKMIYVIQ